MPALTNNNSNSILRNMKKFFSSIFTILMAGMALAQTGPGQYRVDTIQELREINIYGTRLNAWVGGGTAKDDGLGGVFWYDSASTTATNVYAVYEPIYSTGRWFKLPTSVAWQSAAASVSDDTSYAWKFLRGAAQTNVFSIGADNANVYLQTFASKILHVNDYGGNNVVFHGSGTGSLIVGNTLAVTNNVRVDGTLTVGTNAGALPLRAILTAAAQIDFPAIPASETTNMTIAVTGAGTNSACFVSLASGGGAALNTNVTFTAFVDSTNLVSIVGANNTLTAIDPGTTSYRVVVFQY